MSRPGPHVGEGPVNHDAFPNLILFDHPLIQHKLTIARDQATGHRLFRAVVAQVAGLMVFELTRSIPTEPATVTTPTGDTADGRTIEQRITLVPVLRAGLGMTGSVLELIPQARVGHLGLSRDEQTLQPTVYLQKLPADLGAGPTILVDPMLATGGSAVRAVRILRDAGATDLRMLCLIAAPEGVRAMLDADPNVTVYAAQLDERLDGRGFIRPGLGDAGDRLFGTV